MGSATYGARIVTAGYTLLLVITTGAGARAEDAYGSVRGTVTNDVTGERLRKAFVRLIPASDAAHTAVTDGEGRFVFETIPPGNYSLEAEHPGLIEGKYGEDAGAPVELKIAGGQVLSDLSIKLLPPAVISGRVQDEDGDLWTHATVSVFRSVWERGKRRLQGFSSAEVNDAGEFRVAHLPPGRYYIKAEPDASWERRNRGESASQLQPAWYPASLDASSASPVVVLPGQEFTGAEIRLRRGSVYRIRGKVSGLQSIPALPGPSPWMTPRLAVSSTRGVGGNSAGGHLKADGSFEVEGVAPGKWQIRIEQGMLSSLMALGTATVQIDDHDIEGVSLTGQPLHLLKGVVRAEEDDPLPAGFLLRLESSDGLVWDRTTKPREDGSFDFENIPSGQYRVYLQGETSGRNFIHRVRYGDLESPDAGFSVSTANETLELTLSARGALVSGMVRRDRASGSGAPQVVLMPDIPDAGLRGYDTHIAVVDQSGGFTVKEPVQPGDYTIYAFEGVPQGAWTDTEFLKGIEGKGVRIKVGEEETKSVEVPLIPRSGIAALLTRLGMDSW